MVSETETLRATETTFAILERLKEEDTLSISETAEHLGRSKSTIHRHLATLTELGYVRKDDGEYRLGLRLLDLGEHSRAQHDLYEVLKPEVDELVDDTGERAQVMVEENGKGIYIYQASGDRAINTDSHTGKQVYLHSVASGKAYLAHLPEERVAEIVDEVGLPAITSETVTDREALFEELETVRERGYAINDEENSLGIRAVGAPILDQTDGSAVGSLSFAAPKTRLTDELFHEEIPERVCDVATVLGVKSTYE